MKYFIVALIAGLIALPAILASPAFSTSQHDDKPIKIEADLVTIDASVTDKDGNYLRNLRPDEFTITEDGVAQNLDFFEASEQAGLTKPLAVVFDLDISGSIKPEEVIKQREAAESFIRLARPESQFAILAFNYELKVVQNFTSDPKKLSQSFHHLPKVEGSTRLFQSIDRAVSMLKNGPVFRAGRRLRRVVIVITDGYDSVDTLDQRDLIRRANDAGVTVFSITLPSYQGMPGTKRRAITLLDVARIVPKTGGLDFSADEEDFTPAFKAIAEEIKSSYTLAYYPPEKNRRDGKSHQIHIEVKRPGAIVRANRQSYLARNGA